MNVVSNTIFPFLSEEIKLTWNFIHNKESQKYTDGYLDFKIVFPIFHELSLWKNSKTKKKQWSGSRYES